jgi:hypothetical protein
MLLRPCGPWRVAPLLLPGALLSGCPQLLKDDFQAFSGPTGAGSRGGSDPLEDASAGPRPGEGGGTLPPNGPGQYNDGGTVVGLSDADTPPDPVAVALRSALAHRYRFDPGATLLDSIGNAHAVSVGASFSAGAAVLAGTGTGQYIDLPNGLLSGLHNATFEVWVIWNVDNPTSVTSAWQRIFDLGSNSRSVEGEQVELDGAAHALYLTPSSNGSSGGSLQMRCEGCAGTRIEAPASMPTRVQVQIVGVVDDDGDLLAVYQNGQLAGSQPFPGSLSAITSCSGRPAPCDWNNWLGRSQHVEDPPFRGSILDFRIYSAALPARLIQASFAAGPDAAW